MNTLTITADMNDGEVAVFKVKPLVSINEAIEMAEWIVSPQCVAELEKDGVWEIV